MSNIETTTDAATGLPEQQSDAQLQAAFDAQLAASIQATISQAVQSRPEALREPLISSASTPVAAVGDVDAAIGELPATDTLAPAPAPATAPTDTTRGPDGRFQKADPNAAATVTAADPPAAAATLPPPAPGAVPVASAVPAVHAANADPAPVVAETFTYVDNAGASIELTRADIATLLAQRDWANNLPANVRDAFAAIASGQAVAIPRDEWARATGQQAPSFANLSPEQQRYVAELEQRAAVTQQATINASANGGRSSQDLEIAAANAASTAVAAEFKVKYALTPEEEADLAHYTIGLGLIERFAEAGKVFNPVTKDLLRGPDYRDVFERALTIGMASHPRLASRVIDAQVAAQVDARLAANAAVEAKKGRASTISGTPSSALATPRATTANLSRDETQRAIADLIAAGMN